MPGQSKAGYVALAVAQFLDDQIELRARKAGMPASFINNHRVSPDDQRRITRWSHESKLASLAAVDRILIRYDLALWEFEAWATKRYGNNTYFDTDEIIAGLLAAA